MAGYWYERDDYAPAYKRIKRKRKLLRYLSYVQNADRRLAKAVLPDSTTEVSLALMRQALGDDLYLTVPARVFEKTLARRHDFSEGKAQLTGLYVIDGELGKYMSPFMRTPIFHEMKALVEHGDAVRDSAWYKKVMADMAAGKYPQRHRRPIRTEADLDDYLSGYMSLVESVRLNGVLRRSALTEEQKNAHRIAISSPETERKEIDPGLAVDHDNAVSRVVDGFHRCAIALALKLPAVPVELRVVHRQWLRTALARHADVRPTEGLRRAIRELEIELNEKYG